MGIKPMTLPACEASGARATREGSRARSISYLSAAEHYTFPVTAIMIKQLETCDKVDEHTNTKTVT